LAGPPARLVLRGRSGQWGTEGNEAAALALDEDVAGMITPTAGTAAHEMLQVSGRTRVPVVSLCPDSSVKQAGVPWGVRVSPGTEEQARAIFTGLSKTAGGKTARRWTAFVPTGRAGREATRDLKAAAQAAECALVEPTPIQGSGSDRAA